ncbi:hypothetical protein ACIBCT_02935 [Streptosporangium sp. NPDC050855]|uniref:hypothetical protein n=1 Tax=Streptosporangium sp. NPDC050855 TaxID=3366194 RepID=UPI003792228D
MRIHAAQKRDGGSVSALPVTTVKINGPFEPRTPPAERVMPPAPKRTPRQMPPMPTRPTRQPRRIPGKGGR